MRRWIPIAFLVALVATITYFHFTGSSGRPITTPDGRTLIAAYQTSGVLCDASNFCRQAHLSFYDDGSYALTVLFGSSGTLTDDGRLTPDQRTQLVDALAQVTVSRRPADGCEPGAGQAQETVSIVTDGHLHDYPLCSYTVSATGVLRGLLDELTQAAEG